MAVTRNDIEGYKFIADSAKDLPGRFRFFGANIEVKWQIAMINIETMPRLTDPKNRVISEYIHNINQLDQVCRYHFSYENAKFEGLYGIFR
ncbi:MAG: hypothetical protein QNK25_14605 [Desulfobacterales bacterium]|nr:hypothetical protein [Desulfobacterales bacterium]